MCSYKFVCAGKKQLLLVINVLTASFIITSDTELECTVKNVSNLTIFTCLAVIADHNWYWLAIG